MSKINSNLRSALFLGAATAAALSLSSTAMAADVETVTVTGSRIPVQANVQAPTAVTTISSEALQMSGTLNVAEIMNTVPSFGVPGLSPTNSNFYTQGAGISTLELRNLGEDRTLVLVNGRRYVSGLAGSNAVDFNTIPTQLIDRVEVITGGASAIYGSDALAGVVNIILKDDFEGLAASVQHGRTDYNDELQYGVNATIGGNFANGKGNAVVSIGWTSNSGVRSSARPNTRVDDLAMCYVTGDLADCTQSYSPYYSSYSPYGRIGIISTGQQLVVSNGVGPTGTVSPWSSSAYGFNRQAWRAIETPVERVTMAANAHYDISDDVQLYMETTFAQTWSKQRIEPYPHSSDDLYTDGVSINNPYMPQEIRDAAIAAGDTTVAYYRRMLEFGPRTYNARRDMWRGLIGAKGKILGNFDWDTYFLWGHTYDNQSGTGQINIPNMREALNAKVATQADLDAGAAIAGRPAALGDIICSNAYAWAEGCAPVNIFGYGAISDEAIGYINAPALRIDNIDQKVAGGTIRGPVLELPAGQVYLVGGFEWREETASDIPDPLTQTGQNAGNKEEPIYGTFNVWEVFAETEIPVIKNQPLIQELTVGGAWRWSHYSTQGDTTAYTGRVSYSPIEMLRIRGQYARAVRAPNISELYAPGGENFATVSDPCNGITAATTGTVAANCRAVPAIAARIAATGSFTLLQTEIQGTGGFTGRGNPLLTPEKSDTWTIGAVLDHRFEGFGSIMFSVDYFTIDIENVIRALGRQTAIDQCYNSATFPNQFCNYVVRDTSGPAFQQGEITEVNSGYANQGYTKTSGVDFALSHQFDLNELDFLANGSVFGLDDAGQVSTRINYTWLQSFKTESYGTVTDSKGTIGLPVNEAQLGLVYSNGPVSVQYQLNYQGNVYFDVDPTGDFYGAPPIREYFLQDIAFQYQVTDEFQLFGGIKNFMDAKAPNILSGLPDNTTGTDTAADVYDPVGRRYYFGARVKL